MNSCYKRAHWPVCIVFLAALFFQSSTAFGQQDTAFWFAAPDVSSSQGQSPISLRLLSYADPATVTISQPANVGFTPIVVNLAANSSSVVDLTPFLSSIESPAANAASDNGLKITSTQQITAYYELSASNNKEIFSLKGSKALGTNFYTPFQKFWDNATVSPATFSSIEIVATQNNTTVLITPRTNIVGHSVGVTYSVVLQQGQTYSARDVNVTAATSLAGSIISSDKPIAITLFSGALSNAGCTSTVGDQMTPTDYIGQDYIVRKNGPSDRVYILATENGTSLSIHNTTTTNALINWSETYSYALTDTVNYIHSSKPVYVWHVSGYGCNLSGAQVPNLYCAGKYEQAFSRSTADSLALVLYTRSGFEGMFQLNGGTGVISASAFQAVPGTGGNFVAAIVYLSTTDVPVNTYNTVTNSGDVFGMAVLAGAHSFGSAYAYVSEFSSYPFVFAGVDDTICANATLTLNGVVGGGSVTGTWGATGFGSFANSLNSLNNVYLPSNLDSIISPISLILSSTGPCPVKKDTIVLTVTPAPLVNAGADQTVCANNSTVHLGGTVAGGAITGSWVSLGTGTFSPNNTALNADYIPSAADITAGTVKLALTSTNNANCNPVADTMVVTITGAPIVSAGPDTITVCSNNAAISLSGTVSGPTSTAKWTTNGNGVFNPNNLALSCSYTPSPNDIAAGSVKIYLSSTNNGNCLSAKDSVIIVFTPGPQVNAGVNLIACTNNPVVNLTGSVTGPTTTGAWSGGLGTFVPNNTTLNATYIADPSEVSSGNVILTLTSTNNGTCSAEDDFVQISFVSPPFANFSFTEVCEGDSSEFTDFSLNGFGSINSWNWAFGDGFFSTQEDPKHKYSGQGSYDVELIVTSNTGCSDTTMQTVQVFEVPISNFFYDVNCINNQVLVDFYDSSYSLIDTINYYFYDFGGQGSQAVKDPTQLFLGDGNFTITHIVRTNLNCADTSTKVITIDPKPDAGFYYNTSNGLNVGAIFNFIDTSDYAVSWFWEFDNGKNSTLQDPTTIYFENGSYVVSQFVYNSIGCVDSSKLTIQINTVTKEIDKLIPNAISPNGDGKNDVWKLEFIDLINPNAEVAIFNRWGQTIYQSVGYTTPWDGTYNGALVPDGTYYYVINLTEEETYTGSILVLTARKN